MLDGAHVLVTGGAGFIGSHLVDRLIHLGARVTVIDNLSSGSLQRLRHLPQSSALRVSTADLRDCATLQHLMLGIDLVCHLAANGDIAAGILHPERDVDNGLQLTLNVLEAMRVAKVGKMLFASSGSVYGESVNGACNEWAGPLLPISVYAASKLAGESFISSYSHMFGIGGWIFRFGNVVGGGATRGVIYDLARKLATNHEALEVLGDGSQEKPYLLVDDCIDGILHAYRHGILNADHPCEVFNIASAGTTVLSKIVSILLDESDLPDTQVRYTGTQRGWPGDQTMIRLDVSRMSALGWRSRYTSDDAVRVATRQILEEVRP